MLSRYHAAAIRVYQLRDLPILTIDHGRQPPRGWPGAVSPGHTCPLGGVSWGVSGRRGKPEEKA